MPPWVLRKSIIKPLTRKRAAAFFSTLPLWQLEPAYPKCRFRVLPASIRPHFILNSTASSTSFHQHPDCVWSPAIYVTCWCYPCSSASYRTLVLERNHLYITAKTYGLVILMLDVRPCTVHHVFVLKELIKLLPYTSKLKHFLNITPYRNWAHYHLIQQYISNKTQVVFPYFQI